MPARAFAMGQSSSFIGAVYHGGGVTSFSVWAPNANAVALHLLTPEDRIVPLSQINSGYYCRQVRDVNPGALYKLRLNGGPEFPDPASRYQPDGVHGPSAVIDSRFPWTDQKWAGVPRSDLVIYELHIGTFTPAGTFDAAIEYFDYLHDLGITALEVMPVAQFPGVRNWGYDGVYPFSVQSSYGGPDGLKRFVNAAHEHGLAVLLDVVYNHLGPEGNYLSQYGPYFTERYTTPWGQAINFDGEGSDAVRRYFVESAIRWVSEFHMDGLRLERYMQSMIIRRGTFCRR